MDEKTLKDINTACEEIRKSITRGPEFAYLGPNAAKAFLGESFCCGGAVLLEKVDEKAVITCLVCGKEQE